MLDISDPANPVVYKPSYAPPDSEAKGMPHEWDTLPTVQLQGLDSDGALRWESGPIPEVRLEHE